ncbi:MAG TPA: hypothetical protein PLA68_01805 [Panacibacter sp.]|nr:hypothetical protein [Panacibacter sp.]
MGLFKNKKRAAVAEKLSHYLTGFIVILKGIDKAEHFKEHPFIVILLFILGAFIIVATYFHHFFERKVKEFKTLIHITEAVVLLLVTYYYFEEGKTALSFAFLVAAIANFIAAFVLYKKKLRAAIPEPADEDVLPHNDSAVQVSDTTEAS